MMNFASFLPPPTIPRDLTLSRVVVRLRSTGWAAWRHGGAGELIHHPGELAAATRHQAERHHPRLPDLHSAKEDGKRKGVGEGSAFRLEGVGEGFYFYKKWGLFSEDSIPNLVDFYFI